VRVGHQITALVRSPSSLSAQDGLTIVQGTPLTKSDIDMALAATSDKPTAVIITLKPRAATENTPKASALMSESALNVLASMREHGIRKLVVMQAHGTGKSWPSLNFAIRALFTHKSELRAEHEEHDRVENIIREEAKNSELVFVLLRPVMLVAGEALPIKFFPEDGSGIGWLPKITRKSVAGALLDAAETSDHDGTAPVISN
jgi:putative NADH-flavin reductase